MKINPQQVVESYADMVYRIALTHTGCREDAEDIFQEVFISLLKNSARIEDEKHLKFFLIRTTINKAKNRSVCFWKRKVILKEDGQEDAFPLKELEELRQEIKALSPKLRDVVYLHYYEGYSLEEISQILKIKEGTIKSRLFNARKILKLKLTEGES